MNILFITGFAAIAPNPPKSRELYVDALGLPLAAGGDGEYWHSEEIAGSKHLCVWPLSHCILRARSPGGRPWFGFCRARA